MRDIKELDFQINGFPRSTDNWKNFNISNKESLSWEDEESYYDFLVEESQEDNLDLEDDLEDDR